jgi:elongation factor 2
MSKVQADKHDLVATGRIFSGKCVKKDVIYLLRENEEGIIQRLSIFMGQRREQVQNIPVGNIVAIEGLKRIKSGETIVEKGYQTEMLPFEYVKYVSTPVVTVSIEPEYLRDLEKMKGLVENLLIEDPNLNFEINEENGEFLLSGMGPLHLEISTNEIAKRGVNVSVSPPRPVFKESCRFSSNLVSVRTQNNQNSLNIRVQRLDHDTALEIHKINVINGYSNVKLKDLMIQNGVIAMEDMDKIWNIDNNQNILIFRGNSLIEELYKNLILEIIGKIQLSGPLCGEKLTEVMITIEDLIINNLNEETAFTELSGMFYDGIKKALLEAELILLEPIYHTIIQLPPNYIKSTLSLLSKNSAKINKINQDKEYQATIDILIPVRNSIKFAEEIRSTTSGKAFWQNEFYAFMEVPSNEAKQIISDLRFKKGLSW